MYDLSPLALTGNVIAVTLNYRLGVLGFLAHPTIDAEGHAFANYGLQDQQLALRWVQNNIRRFGGDPEKVTMFGESSGGLNVFSHLISPQSAGLYGGAIIQSGAYDRMIDAIPSASVAQWEGLFTGQPGSRPPAPATLLQPFPGYS
jgi:para-nitrobenzyl esterase